MSSTSPSSQARSSFTSTFSLSKMSGIQSLSLDAIHHDRLQVHLHGKGKCVLQQHQRKALLHYPSKSLLCIRFGSSRSCSKSSSPLVRSSVSQPWPIKSASNIIAEIDDKVISDSKKIILEEENQEDDLSQHAQVPQCLEVPSTPSSAERENFMSPLLSHSGHGARFVRRQKDFMVSAPQQSQKKSSVIQLDHSFYKVPGSVQSLKVLTVIETSTSMRGAVIVPDLSANQVGVKALKRFIMVSGFTHSVLQCDGRSGLTKLQDQVGKDLSLPTQISPPYSHQSQGTVERFHKTLYGQVRAIKLGLAAHLRNSS